MTIADWLQTAQTQLKQAGIASAQLDAELIIGHTLGQNREQVLAHPELEISTDDKQQADELLAARVQRHPLVHLTGEREFYGLSLEITPVVLTPRVETETMVEAVIKDAPKQASLLDVGTGSGAIAIAIAKHRPDLTVTASDISQSALTIASRNADKHQVKLRLMVSDLLSKITGKFDVVTANLPYLHDNAELMPEVQHEPKVALLGGADGLKLYRRFFDQLDRVLKPGGQVFVEADPWQHEELAKIAAKAKLQLQHDDYFIMAFTKS